MIVSVKMTILAANIFIGRNMRDQLWDVNKNKIINKSQGYTLLMFQVLFTVYSPALFVVHVLVLFLFLLYCCWWCFDSILLFCLSILILDIIAVRMLVPNSVAYWFWNPNMLLMMLVWNWRSEMLVPRN